MNHRTWPALLLAAGCWLGTARPAGAQPVPLPGGSPPHNPSHLPISDGGFDPQAAEELLAQRLRRARDGRELEGLKKLVEDLLKDKDFQEKLKDPEFVKELQKRAKSDPEGLVNDPNLKPLLEKFREGKDGQKGPSPELLEDLKKQMEKLRPGASPNPKAGDPSKPGLPENPPHTGPQPGQSAPPPPPTGPVGPPKPPPAPPVPMVKHQEPPSWINQQFKGLTRGLLERMGDARNSPWMRDFLKGILEQKAGGGGWKFKPPEGNEWAKHLEGVRGYLPSMKGFFDTLGTPFRNWKMPSVGGDWSAPSLPSLPAMEASPAEAAEQGGTALLWVGLLALAVMVIWKVLSRSRARAALAAAQAMGPWPVPPAAVRTREELVRAFEYLALLVLGPAARTRNHLDVAEGLGAVPALDADRRREAAGHLARLYEKARYAPGDEPLPEAELAGARRELSLLAGVAGA
jgi:hypothetical protein